MEAKDYIALCGVVLTGGLGIWNLARNRAIEKEQQGNRDKGKRGDERRYGALLSILSAETVGLFDRMIQYCEQAKGDAISFSRPFVLLGTEQLTELVHLGASASVLRAVIKVREVNDLVTRSVDRAQSILAGDPDPDSYEVPDRAILSQAAQSAKLHFNSASAFVQAEYKDLVRSVQLILETASQVAPSESIRMDESRFKAACARYDQLGN